MTKYEEKIMAIIANAGEAKSFAFEAINSAKKGKYQESQKQIAQGNKSSIIASKAHFDLLADARDKPVTMLLVHAEDQMMTSQLMLDLAREFIDLYQKINK